MLRLHSASQYRIPRRLAVLVSLAAFIVLAACGGGSKSSNQPAVSNASTGVGQAAVANVSTAGKLDPSGLVKGWAVDRATSADGRWAYTLYANPGGYPFIHALDTVRGVAHCVGLPWTATDQNPVYSFHLALKRSSVVVHWSDGRVWRSVDTTSWRVSK